MGLTDAKAKPLRDRDMDTKKQMVIAWMKRTGSAAVSTTSIDSIDYSHIVLIIAIWPGDRIRPTRTLNS